MFATSSLPAVGVVEVRPSAPTKLKFVATVRLSLLACRKSKPVLTVSGQRPWKSRLALAKAVRCWLTERWGVELAVLKA